MRTRNSSKRTISNSKSKNSPVDKSGIQTRRKKQKIEKASEPESESSDSCFLSSLPDNVLCHIMSFLDTKSAIRTSVLSKRYRMLWTQLENLHFTSSGSDSTWFLPNFETKVKALLQRRDETINLTSFRLSLYHHRPTMEFVNYCVNYAALRNLQHFRMRVYLPFTVLVPASLVNSTCLTSLRLSNAIKGGLRFPMKVNMVNLKELHLKKFEFSSQNYDGGLFRGCPSLESLVLDKCWSKSDDKLKVLEVDCATLRKLEIKHWRSHWTRFHQFSIEIKTPKLVSFKFQGLIVRLLCKEILSCLDSVYFDLGYPTGCAESIINERKQRTLESILSMLRWFCKAKFMALSWQTFEVLCDDPDLQLHSPITFSNLKSIRFTDEWTSTEIRLPVQTVRESLDPAHGTFHFDGPKQLGGDVYNVSFGLPGKVFQYFLENSPSLEFFYFDVQKKPGDEDGLKPIQRIEVSMATN